MEVSAAQMMDFPSEVKATGDSIDPHCEEKLRTVLPVAMLHSCPLPTWIPLQSASILPSRLTTVTGPTPERVAEGFPLSSSQTSVLPSNDSPRESTMWSLSGVNATELTIEDCTTSNERSTFADFVLPANSTSFE